MSEKDYTDLFVANVRRLMDSEGWGTNDLAEAIGVKAPVISRLLHAAHPPRASTIVAVCNAFSVSVCELFCAVPDSPPPKPRKKK